MNRPRMFIIINLHRNILKYTRVPAAVQIIITDAYNIIARLLNVYLVGPGKMYRCFTDNAVVCHY